MENNIQIKFVPVEDCEFNEGQIPGCPSNPRTREEERQKKLEKSIEELPEMTVARACLVYKYNGKYVVIGGNRRLEAHRALNKKKIPVIEIPENTPIDKIRRIAIIDNESTGKTDWQKIKEEWNLEEIKDWGVDLPQDWNFPEEVVKEAKEDDFSEEDAKDVETRVKIGEIWQLGEHRLMCGDSTDAASVALLMDGQKADMVFTDPPYGVSIGDKNKALNSVQKAGCCTENIANDNISVNDLYPILVKAMINCRENCKDCACYYITSPQGGELGLMMMMMMMMKDAGLPVRHMLIWEKNCATFSLGRLDYDYQHEPIFYTWTKSHKNYRNGEFRTTIWKYDKPRKCDLHPTMKPVELVANCMMDASVEGDIVLDMFGGSGTTIIAAEQLARRARLMELDPHYCDVIIARWEKLTGKEAVKIYG
jgi:DNA modification methylase